MSDGPLILAFDTTAARCAAALVHGDTTLFQISEAMKRGQAERLVPMLEETLVEAGRKWSDIDGLAVLTGPGNFTGIRLSVATARGLALSLNIPAIGVTGFEAAAHGMQRAVLAFTDNGRGNTSCQLFVEGRAISEPTENPADLSLAADVICTGVQTDFARSAGFPFVEKNKEDHLWRAAQVAMCKLRNGETSLPVPLYVRKADAAPSSDLPPVILDDA
ncbi:tRNA (adenosine(37)-N6)-threonylcarbamoyltransferase complex dimerization subunit type 1 TsaB [Amaricoccus tamworthensis]|uniref:tRNA (adenosine(37)-N6)-threonylcarbamoyltransferase complex dimerization subunit type 1 TsaB n=1 Tax=Amaricoccus tamworthensis TaxID=57002 RepID=UPI003C7A2348